MKYGALSNDKGRVEIAWTISGPKRAETFTLSWREIGGPSITKPRRAGFGSVVTRKLVASMFDAAIDAQYRRSGFAWTLECPLAKVTGRAGTEGSDAATA